MKIVDYTYEKNLLRLVQQKAREGNYADSQLTAYLKEVYEQEQKDLLKPHISHLDDAKEQLTQSSQLIIDSLQKVDSEVNWCTEISLISKNIELIVQQARYYYKRRKKPNLLIRRFYFLMKRNSEEEKVLLDLINNLIYIRRYLEHTQNSSVLQKEKVFHIERFLRYLKLVISQSEQLCLWLINEIKAESRKNNPQYF